VLVRPLDAYGALAYLRTRADIDATRIGLMGWSNGGSATLASMAPGISRAGALGARFARPSLAPSECRDFECLSFLSQFHLRPVKEWKEMARPSSRRVARKMSQAGQSVLHETIKRWRRNGWRPLQQEQRHPLETALESIDGASRRPIDTGKKLVEQSAEGARSKNFQMPSLSGGWPEVARAVCVITRMVIVQTTPRVTEPAKFAFPSPGSMVAEPYSRRS
jgi:hypothetical protein